MEAQAANEATRSLATTPTWSVATVLTILVAISFLAERSLHRFSHWLHKAKKKALLQALEKMKEEMMLFGFLSLLLTATTKSISGICIKSSYYESVFAPCKVSSLHVSSGRKLLQYQRSYGTSRHLLSASAAINSCRPGYEPFVSFEGLEQLHRFIFVLAVTQVVFSCLTMLLASIKVYGWKRWEMEALSDTHDGLAEITKALTIKRQSTFVTYHTSRPWSRNRLFVWVVCFFRQFGQSVTRADYLTLRFGFINNHGLVKKFNFHSYMIRSMEEEFQEIVGISPLLWALVVTLMLFNIEGWNLYFWTSFLPVVLVLIVGTKLQHIIATLALENAGMTNNFAAVNVKLRDELFWFNKPELLLWLIHFILFQNAFELGTFFWFLWQFGLKSCFLTNVAFLYVPFLYVRLGLGIAGQILCSYSTLPLYALVTQMGTKYKLSMIPVKIRESIHGWQKAAKKKVRHGTKGHASVEPLSVITQDDSTLVEYIHEGLEEESALVEVEMNMYPEALPGEDHTVRNSPVQRAVSLAYPHPIDITTVDLQENYHRSSSQPAIFRFS